MVLLHIWYKHIRNLYFSIFGLVVFEYCYHRSGCRYHSIVQCMGKIPVLSVSDLDI